LRRVKEDIPLQATKSIGQKIFNRAVEKIYPNLAVVVVNDKWRARLTSEDYTGPRAIDEEELTIQGNCRFVQVDGTLCIRINEVVELLN